MSLGQHNLIGAVLTTLLCAPTVAASQSSLADMSLEELSSIEITSVSRRSESLTDAAASIHVISAEAIRRSGAISLAEALRLAPNLQVARIDAGQYAISARGFNNAIGNKLLVLIDGRTVYTPFFSGVFWDQQDVMLEDVARIEVISGPGATLWGANAVNGVINVITHGAAQTQGLLLSTAVGNREQVSALRYGGTLSDAGRFRVYAKHLRHEKSQTAAGSAVPDRLERSQLGFRVDWGGAVAGFTVQGDVYSGKSGTRGVLGPVTIGGANLLARWTQQLSGGSNLRLQAYYDRTRRRDLFLFQPQIETFDLEFQHGISLGAHQLMWGGGYRRAKDEIQPGIVFGFDPVRKTQTWTNWFVQDEVALRKDLDLIVGAKLERNDFTGWEILPSLRLAWKPADRQLLWGAVSRAVRAPARLDRDIRFPPNPPFVIAGGPDFKSEVAQVIELGYRVQPTAASSLSLTLFQHRWDRLRSGQPPMNAQVQNMIYGKSYGLESWGQWQVAPYWRLSAGLTLLRKDLRLRAGSTDPVGPSELGNDPERQWSVHSSFKLPHRQELDVELRRVGALPRPAVPAYTALDLRYAWAPRPKLELSLTARNLLDRFHTEFGAMQNRAELERALLVQLRWTP